MIVIIIRTTITLLFIIIAVIVPVDPPTENWVPSPLLKRVDVITNT